MGMGYECGKVGNVLLSFGQKQEQYLRYSTYINNGRNS